MKALLLAAGFGTRLRPITDSVPKCLVPVRGRPLLDYWLDSLLPSAIERVLVNTHYLAGAVARHVERSPWRDRIDLVHEPALLGTGGTVLANAGYFGSRAFMAAHADNLTRFDPAAFIAAHDRRLPDTVITMMTFDTDNPQSCGIVEQDGAGRVVAFHEKQANPPGSRASAAVYIMEPAVVDFLATLEQSQIDISLDVIPHFLGRIQTYHNADYHRDIGSPESLRLAEAEF